MTPRDAAEQRTVAALEPLGAHSLAELQALPADKVATLRNQGIIIDGWIVPEDLSKTFADGRQNKVDVLLGSNANEGGSFGGFGPPTTLATWQAGAVQRWGDLGRSA
jgi:para-nitrobenzyl esterase